MKRSVLIGLFGLVVLAGVVAIIHWRSPSNSKMIAFVVPALDTPFFVDMTDAARQETASLPGYKLLVQAPTNFTDVEQQIGIVEDEITRKVSIICLDASDSKGILPALKKAQDANIPVLLVDDTVDPIAAAVAHLKPIPHVGADNYLGGRLAAEFIGKSLNGQSQVAMLEGVVGSDVANARKRGFLAGLAEFPGIKLVASQTANYDRAQAVDVFRTILLAHPDLNALFAANDEMALGAVKALSSTEPQKKIVIVGFDATADGLKAIKSGALSATIQQQPKEMGRIAVRLADKIVRGTEVPAETLIPVKLITGAGQ